MISGLRPFARSACTRGDTSQSRSANDVRLGLDTLIGDANTLMRAIIKRFSNDSLLLGTRPVHLSAIARAVVVTQKLFGHSQPDLSVPV